MKIRTEFSRYKWNDFAFIIFPAVVFLRDEFEWSINFAWLTFAFSLGLDKRKKK